MEIKEINFQYKGINAISQKQFDVHMELYKGYVSKINEITQKLERSPEREGANATYSYYRGLKDGETYALDGVILHELYFSNLGGLDKKAFGKALKLITRDFGSLENWQEDFIACGKAARGWAVLAYDQRSKMLRNILCDAHDKGPIWTAYPILVMDVYEHAYYVDYANKKNDYINRFMKDINWEVVEARAEKIR